MTSALASISAWVFCSQTTVAPDDVENVNDSE